MSNPFYTPVVKGLSSQMMPTAFLASGVTLPTATLIGATSIARVFRSDAVVSPPGSTGSTGGATGEAMAMDFASLLADAPNSFDAPSPQAQVYNHTDTVVGEPTAVATPVA